MGSESPKSGGDRGRSNNAYSMWIVVTLVAFNLLALYSFALQRNQQNQQQLEQQQHQQQQQQPPLLREHSNLTRALEQLQWTQAELERVKYELSVSVQQLQQLLARSGSSSNGDETAATAAGCDCFISRKEDFPSAPEFQRYIATQELPLGYSPTLKSETLTSPVGHSCLLQREDLERYMSYTPFSACPDDGELVQKLLTGGCEPLPRRRCFARSPPAFSEPLPLPESLWTLPPDANVLWTPYPCKSFDCLNERKRQGIFADCLDCFDLSGRESERWSGPSGGGLQISIAEVLSLKSRGAVRIGLDIGGGTATFAARMREFNVTIVTSSLNFDGPFNNFIALRGLLPLYLTISQRFPFFDNTLDMVHSMHVLSHWIPFDTLEFLLFDIDRVLRPGGLFWLDRFFCLEHQMRQLYIPLVEKLGYKKLRWAVAAKLDRGPEVREMYLSAVLEKPRRR